MIVITTERFGDIATGISVFGATVAAFIAIALATPREAHADDVPRLNIEPVCRGIASQAATPAEKGGPDLAYKQCIDSEQEMRQRLVQEWSSFQPSDRRACVGDQMGGQASYTDLVTCLEMARDARQLKASSPNR
jgi:hypothetical protein